MPRRILIAPEWHGKPELAALLHELPEFNPERIEQRLKDNAVSLVARLQVDGQGVILKRYRTTSFLKRLNRSVRPSKAYRNWWAGQQMAALRIPSMRAIACFERRLGPLQFDPVFIGTLADGPDMIAYLSRFSAEDASWELGAREIISRVARLHQAGLVHGDLNWTNIRFTEQGPTFLDLDDVRAPRLAVRRRYLMLRDWRVLIYNWRDRPAMQQRFSELVQEQVGEAFFREIQARPFRAAP